MFVSECPKNFTLLTEYEMAVNCTDYIDSDTQGSKDVNFTLQPWARFLLSSVLFLTLPMLSRILILKTLY
jgi:hypothetical protein